MDPAPITTKRIARATRLDVRPRGAPDRPLALLRIARVGVPERVLAAQLVHGPPGEVDDLLVRQVAEVRADLFPLLAEAEEVLRSEEHTSELQSHSDLVCRLLLEKKKKKKKTEKNKTDTNHCIRRD